jgi:hypothetical protein
MKLNPKIVAAGLVTVGLVLGAVALAAADDESSDIEIKLQAPLDAVDCTPGASTITVFGQTIDINTATIDASNDGSNSGGSQDDNGGSQGNDSNQASSGQGGENDQGGGDGHGSTNGGSGQVGCAALAAQQVVEVKFASDAAPLVATAVDSQDGGDGEPEVKGPIQGMDTTNQTVTVLGYTISVIGANLDGADDNSQDGNNQPVTLDQLIVGQSVEIKLDATQLPALVATELQVKNFTNQVTVEVDDSNGQEVDDTDSNGAPVNDVEVDVTETVPVQGSTTGAATTRRVRKVVHLRHVTNGSFQLSGLPTGHAKIQVTRTANGATFKGRKAVKVSRNTRKSTRIHLRRTH